MCGLNVLAVGRMPLEVVVDAEHAHLVAHLAQRLDDVVLHLPLGLEDVDAGRVVGRHQVVVDEGEDADLLHRNRPVPAAVQVVHRLHGEQHRELLPRLSSGPASRSFSSRQRAIMSSSTWSIVYW